MFATTRNNIILTLPKPRSGVFFTWKHLYFIVVLNKFVCQVLNMLYFLFKKTMSNSKIKSSLTFLYMPTYCSSDGIIANFLYRHIKQMGSTVRCCQFFSEKRVYLRFDFITLVEFIKRYIILTRYLV